VTSTTPARATGSRATAAGADRFWDLEGMRGLCAVLIVVFHAYQYCTAGGRYDLRGTPLYPFLYNMVAVVGLFFALSAFVLWRPMVQRVMTGHPAVRPADWLGRRAVRILPVYWTAILVVWASRNPRFPGDWRDLVEHLTFTEIYDDKRIFYTDGPAWSVADEVMFYAFLGLVGWLLVRSAAHRAAPFQRWLILGAPTVIWLVVLPVIAYVTITARHVPVERWGLYFGPLMWSSSFGAGMLLAMAHVAYARRWSDRPMPRWAVAAMRLAGVGCYLAAASVLADTPSRLTVLRVACGLAAALLLASSVWSGKRSLWRRALQSRPLVFSATISYSLYLWHEPVLLLMHSHHMLSQQPGAFPVVAAVLLAVSMPVAYLSYRGIERPAALMRLLPAPRRPGGAAIEGLSPEA
jgi:peptidoglycan/LPS O-acetylase OafA/YrhL